MRTGRLSPDTLRRLTVLTVSAVIVLRGLIAPGFMPSSISDGFPIRLCPQGLDAQWYAAITGPQSMDEHAHHLVHHGGHHGGHHDIHHAHHYTPAELSAAQTTLDTAPLAPGATADHPLEHCALGQALSLLALPTFSSPFDGVGPPPSAFAEFPVLHTRSWRAAFLARAPPLPFASHGS